MGELADVVLDALPADTAFTSALQSIHLLPVSRWLLRQPAEALYACRPATVKRVLDQLVPVGSFFEASGGGFCGIGLVSNADLDIEAGFGVERTAGGARLDAHGAVGAGGDLATPGAQLTGARAAQVGFWAECGVAAGCAVEASWNFDVPTMLGRLPLDFVTHLGDLAAGEALVDLFELGTDLFELPAPDAISVTASAELGAEASGTTAAPPLGAGVPPAVVALLQVHLAAAGALSYRPQVGARDGAAFLAAECEIAARGELGGLAAGGSETARVEVELPLPGGEALTPEQALDAATRFTLEFRSRDARGDEGRESYTYDTLAGLLAGLASGGADREHPFRVGDLVRGRKRTLSNPTMVKDLLPWWPQGQALGGNFVFDQDVRVEVDIEIVVLETALTGRLLTCEATDEESCREAQRELSRQMLAETEGDRDVDFAEVAELRKAEVVVAIDSEAGLGARTPVGGLGGSGNSRMGRKADLADQIDGTDVERLLRA